MKIKNFIYKIIHSKYQTKNWRKSQPWYINGKHNECENYQVSQMESILKQRLTKIRGIRIHAEKKEIINKLCPYSEEDGFEYTEDFDRILNYKDKKIYFSFKFVCDSGGAQTRTLKETYHFIKNQLEILKTNENIIFVNILDGDGSYKHKVNFKIFKNKNLYVGDLFHFSKYWSKCETMS